MRIYGIGLNIEEMFIQAFGMYQGDQMARNTMVVPKASTS